TPTALLSDPSKFTHVAVIGGLLKGQAHITPAGLEYLKEAYDANCTLLGLCTGSFVLARANLLVNRKCCVHWYHRDDFIEQFPQTEVHSDCLFMQDGRIITSAGGYSSVDLATNIIASELGENRARKIADTMLLTEARDDRYPQFKIHLKR